VKNVEGYKDSCNRKKKPEIGYFNAVIRGIRDRDSLRQTGEIGKHEYCKRAFRSLLLYEIFSVRA
jgi:hypothetical protein